MPNDKSPQTTTGNWDATAATTEQGHGQGNTGLARTPISWRGIGLGLLMAVLACAVVAWAEYLTYRVSLGNLQMPPVAVCLLFLFVLGNRLVGRLWPRLRLRPAELAVAYVMMLVAAMVSSIGVTEALYPALAYPRYFAEAGNNWHELLFVHLKDWLVPWDPGSDSVPPAIRYYYEELPTGASIPWRPWVVPVAAWLLLFGFIYAVFMGMSTVIHRLWADEERLSFPLTQLPLELIQASSGQTDFLRNKLLWIGFALPVVTMGMNGLHEIWPQIPAIWRIYLNPQVAGGSRLHFFFSLAGVGIFYLLPSDVALSVWFFILFATLQEYVGRLLVGAAAAGPGLSPPWISDQSAGVAFAMVGLMVYTSWTRVRRIWRRQLDAEPGATNTLLGFPAAVWLMVAGFVGIMLWWRTAGGSLPAGLAEFGIYLFVQAVIVARATCEAGIPMAPSFFTPLDIWGIFGRQDRVGKTNLALMGFTKFIFTHNQRGILITGLLDAQKIADGVRIHRRHIVGIVAAVVILSVVLSGGLHLALTYQRGALIMNDNIYKQPVVTWRVQAPLARGLVEYHPIRILWFATGVLLCLFLGVMRRLYLSWPLQPLGAALCTTWAVHTYWFPAFCSWLIKTALMRYGGHNIYTKLRPLFLGLIFGEFFMAFFWTLVSFVFHTTPPLFPWM